MNDSVGVLVFVGRLVFVGVGDSKAWAVSVMV
jgi:hypothetical protein